MFWKVRDRGQGANPVGPRGPLKNRELLGVLSRLLTRRAAPERDRKQEVEGGSAQTEGHRAQWERSRRGLLQGWRVHSREEGVEGSEWRSDVLWLSCE